MRRPLVGIDAALPSSPPKLPAAIFGREATGRLTEVRYGAPNAFDPALFRIDGARPAECTPLDGSLFSIGITPIVCTAVDSAGNSATATTFNVVVSPPDVVPEGFCGEGFYFDDDAHTCVPTVPLAIDVCSNLEGVQSEVPAGTVRDGDTCIPLSTSGAGGGGAGGSSSGRGEVLGATATTQVSASGGSCYVFQSDLTLGFQGEAVRMLQQFLIGKGYAIPAGATGYFGGQTVAALKAYQSASDIRPSLGYFGPLTRAHVNASCPRVTSQEPTLEELLAKLAELQAALAALR